MKTDLPPIARIRQIFIAPRAGDPMRSVSKASVIIGKGLKGDRYFDGEGSWNTGKPGNRQVTFINSYHVDRSSFKPEETRRNVVLDSSDPDNPFELNEFIGRHFTIGEVLFFGEKYCTSCGRPSSLAKRRNFRNQFLDVGGVIAQVVRGGMIRVGDEVRLLPREEKRARR